MVRKKGTTNKDKGDFSQGLRCLAHLIAESYLRKEKEKFTKEKIQEGSNENS